ncbi:MAG: putative MPP superfamily phosphohydrolase [Flavobacterium sp.]|jgi:predicted MPP superfamily phosphohydrolase
MFRIVVLLIIIVSIELYAFQAIKTITNSKPLLIAYSVISFGVILFVFYQFTQFDRKIGQTSMTMLTLGVLLLVVIPKLILTFFLLLEDVIRILFGIKNYFSENSESASFLPNRRKFISQIALGLASIPFVSLLYGMTKGKYNFKVLKQTIFYSDLPEGFDGFQITQISDVHSGSFDDAEKIEFAIDLINQQNSDMILFTGDIVNTHAKEMHPWIETFKKIKPHKYGKFSVLGNHDYGEYIDWNSQAEKDANFEAIKNLYGDINFKLLLNENIKVTKDQSEIAIVGVENWGNNFKKLGDIDKATASLQPSDFKILMSHDPSHWNFIVKDHPKNIHLTVSGHTHGFQFGIEIPGFLKWSPVQYVYKQWAGLYENLGRYIYVNRGFGFHAYPGRVGIWPEITVIELRRK